MGRVGRPLQAGTGLCPEGTTPSGRPTLVSRGLDLRFQSEGLSLSSYGQESRSWARGELVLSSQRFSPSDGVPSYVSTPSDSFRHPEFGVEIDECSAGESASAPLNFSRLSEGTSRLSQSVGSTSSHSEGSEFEPTSKAHIPSQRSSSSHCSFMSKPVHPVSFQACTAEAKEAHGSAQTSCSKSGLHSDLKSIRTLTELQSPWWMEIGVFSQRGAGQWMSASSIGRTDFSEPLQLECSSHPYNNLHVGSKCSLCERFLSQRSPWGSRRIVGSGDMPVTAVLSCHHGYHVECLERTTPKNQKHDPPCPLCEKTEENVLEQWAFCKFKNEVPRLKPLGEEGCSRVWTCGQAGDCVAGALQTPKRNNMFVLNPSPVKRQLLLKGSPGKGLSENSKKGVLCSSQVFDGQVSGDQVAAGCSRTASNPALKRC